MLEDIKVSRPLMKRIKSTREMTEPWGAPALVECRSERKPSTLTAINLSQRQLAIHSIVLMEEPCHNHILW